MELRLASSSSPPPPRPQPPAPSPHSGFKPVPSELPSCICFLLELLNVTLEGAATPKASSSPPPFAVVGCESLAWRQSLGSQQGLCALLGQTDKPAPREMLCTQAALPQPPPHPRFYILKPICTFHQVCLSPNVLGPQHSGRRSCHSSFPAPLCPPPLSSLMPLLHVLRGWQVFSFCFVLLKWIRVGFLQSSI